MYIRAKGEAFVPFRLVYSTSLASIILKQISSNMMNCLKSFLVTVVASAFLHGQTFTHPDKKFMIKQVYLWLHCLDICIKSTCKFTKETHVSGCAASLALTLHLMLWTKQIGQVLQYCCALTENLGQTMLVLMQSHPLARVSHQVSHTSKVRRS